jgi:phage terminase large subunit-like protein
MDTLQQCGESQSDGVDVSSKPDLVGTTPQMRRRKEARHFLGTEHALKYRTFYQSEERKLRCFHVWVLSVYLVTRESTFSTLRWKLCI